MISGDGTRARQCSFSGRNSHMRVLGIESPSVSAHALDIWAGYSRGADVEQCWSRIL